jgi:hypothetical protein
MLRTIFKCFEVCIAAIFDWPSAHCACAEQAACCCVNQELLEELVVVEANAVADPWTMMVKFENAFAAKRTMVYSWRLYLLAFFAEAIQNVVCPELVEKLSIWIEVILPHQSLFYSCCPWVYIFQFYFNPTYGNFSIDAISSVCNLVSFNVLSLILRLIQRFERFSWMISFIISAWLSVVMQNFTVLSHQALSDQVVFI